MDSTRIGHPRRSSLARYLILLGVQERTPAPNPSRRHPNGSSRQATHVVARYHGDGAITLRTSMTKPATKLYFETCRAACEWPSEFDARLRMHLMDVLVGTHQTGCLR